jgi:hypothetical protein
VADRWQAKLARPIVMKDGTNLGTLAEAGRRLANRRTIALVNGLLYYEREAGVASMTTIQADLRLCIWMATTNAALMVAGLVKLLLCH